MARTLTLLLLALLAAGAAADGKAVVFPATPAGRHAEAWFAAVNAGDDALRAFFESRVPAAALERRPIEERLAAHRGIREEHGRLTPLSIQAAAESEVTVLAGTGHGARLAITFLCEPDPPHGLLGLRIVDQAEGEPEAPEPAGPALAEPEVVAALRAHLDSLARADAFSGAVLLARGDSVLLRDAWGLASREQRSPNTPGTRFNLGSINKAFTRIAIEQLAAAGELALTDTVSRWLMDAEYPHEKGRRLTLRDLLEHRGGTGDIFNARLRETGPANVRTLKDWLAIVSDQPLEFDPGTRQRYSNAGYVLLGAIVEKAAGRSYYDHVRERIYGPAGMTSSDSYALEERVPDLATGYTRRGGGGWRPNRASLPGRGSPAGGGYSTVDDLLRFARAVREGRLGVPAQDGLGIAGGSPGVNAVLEVQGHYTVVVLANLDPPIAERIASRLSGWLRRAGADAGHDVERRDPAGKPGRTVLPPGGIEVPMRRSGHLPAVGVMVNGQGPFRFALDTGASGSVRVDSALAAKLGLRVVGEARGGDPSGRNLVTMPLVAIDSLEIGGARFVGLTGAVRNYNERGIGEPVDGILGFGLFAEGLLTLDYPADRLRFAAGELPAAAAGVVPFTDERGIPVVRLTVGGIEVEADVDAGAAGGFILPESMAARLKLASVPRVVGRARTLSNSFEIKAAQLEGEVALAGIRFVNPTVEFQPVFPMANVGARVLRDLVVTFDRKNRRMKLEKPA